jgi:2-polyprenyl-3-methyl-5-hydroxy-6-metoxy-1,4-benzoquinol methylase
LSIGCGYPSTEAYLVQNNYAVTAIPLDPIVGALAAARGIKVTVSDFGKAFNDLDGTLFDCIIFSEVLQHLEDPANILSRASKLLAPDGELLISIQNYRYLKFLRVVSLIPYLRDGLIRRIFFI